MANTSANNLAASFRGVADSMASHNTAIAKATFAASLLRPDPKSVSREEVNHFHTLLDATIIRCSRVDVENCRAWLVERVMPSPGRVKALGKYLTATSANVGRDGKTDEKSKWGLKSLPSIRKMRMHILYLLNDILHDAKYHGAQTSSTISLYETLERDTLSILKNAASFKRLTSKSHHQRLDNLLRLWDENAYFDKDFDKTARETVKRASDNAAAERESLGDENGVAVTADGDKELPYTMPAYHGDPSTPGYDLPAANIIPHLIPGSRMPINSQDVKPLQFKAGPASEDLSNTVKTFLKEVESMLDPSSVMVDEGIVADIDDMGHALIPDQDTGDLFPLETYYGWSANFCKKMKEAKRKGTTSDGRRNRDRSRSSSFSDGRRKRRRYSDSVDSRRSYSRSRSRSLSRTPPRALPPNQPVASAQHHNGRPRQLPAGLMRNPSFHDQPLVTPTNQMDEAFPSVVPPPPVPPNQYPHHFPIGPGGLPIPPPPPFHQGPWPPTGPMQGGFAGAQGGWMPPPPPKPPNWTGPWPPAPPPPSAFPGSGGGNQWMPGPDHRRR